MQAAGEVVGRFIDVIINPTLVLIFAAGFFLFLWGLVVFLFKIREGSVPDEGKKHMLWGLIGMLVMLSAYGIIALIENTFDLKRGQTDVGRLERVLPRIHFGGGGN